MKRIFKLKIETWMDKHIELYYFSDGHCKCFQNRPNSSEEQELERIRNLQKEVALHRKKNEASYKAALAGSE